MTKIPRKPTMRIPGFRLVPQPLDTAAADMAKFKYAPPEIGTRHKLGGEPDFIQGDDYPICRDCRQRMTFYAQLDSINDQFCLGDCGMIYIFVCFGCLESTSIIQCY